MSINRTAWAALLDDTGGGIDGTIINKALIASLLLDPIDAALLAVEQTTTLTGSQHDFALSSDNGYLRCNNATALVLTGLKVGALAFPPVGARVVIDCVGAGTVRLAEQDGGSVPAARLITGSARGQSIGAGGRLLALWDNATGRWRVTVLDPGAPIAVAYNAGDFTASAGTWTVDAGDVINFTYQQRGALVTLYLYLNAFSISATPGALRIALPNSFVAAANSMATGVRKDNGTWGSAALYLAAADTYLSCALDTFASWAIATNNSNLFATVTIRVN